VRGSNFPRLRSRSGFSGHNARPVSLSPLFAGPKEQRGEGGCAVRTSRAWVEPRTARGVLKEGVETVFPPRDAASGFSGQRAGSRSGNGPCVPVHHPAECRASSRPPGRSKRRDRLYPQPITKTPAGSPTDPVEEAAQEQNHPPYLIFPSGGVDEVRGDWPSARPDKQRRRKHDVPRRRTDDYTDAAGISGVAGPGEGGRWERSTGSRQGSETPHDSRHPEVGAFSREEGRGQGHRLRLPPHAGHRRSGGRHPRTPTSPRSLGTRGRACFTSTTRTCPGGATFSGSV
jgi:hypothetical protein